MKKIRKKQKRLRPGRPKETRGCRQDAAHPRWHEFMTARKAPRRGALFGSFWASKKNKALKANKKNKALQANKKNKALQANKKNKTIQESKVSQKRFQESKSQRKE